MVVESKWCVCGGRYGIQLSSAFPAVFLRFTIFGEIFAYM